MFSINEGVLGQLYYFKKVANAVSSERHLANLGFVDGAKIRILSQTKKGDLILLVKEARLAISLEVAQQIFVTVAKSNESHFQTLDQLTVGSSSQVEKVLGEGLIRRRLMDMGLTRGVALTIRKVAPLGDPIEVTIRGYELTLRKKEAELVLVKDVSADDN